MITEAYAPAFYAFIYGQLGLAKQDNIRYAFGQWLDRVYTTEAFLAQLQRVADCIS